MAAVFCLRSVSLHVSLYVSLLSVSLQAIWPLHFGETWQSYSPVLSSVTITTVDFSSFFIEKF